MPDEPTFTCTKCGKCCQGFDGETGVLIFPQDLERLVPAVETSQAEFTKNYCELQPVRLAAFPTPLLRLKHKNGQCVFLSDDMTCSIYEHRPIQCERAPFRFFWRSRSDFPFDCIKDVRISHDWSSEEWDLPLVLSLRHEDDHLAPLEPTDTKPPDQNQ